MASWMTNRGKFESGNLDMDAQDLRLMLADTPPASEAAMQDLNFAADVVADELPGAGRITLAGENLTEDDTNNWALLGASNPAAVTGLNGPTFAGCWLYRFLTNDASSPLWCWLEATDVVTNGGDLNITLPNGLIRLT